MPDGGKPNANFDAEMRKYERARKGGTPEHAKRLNYPGDAARNHRCTDVACMNCHIATDHSTWYLCDVCSQLAPDTIEYYTHVPYKVLPASVL